MLVLTAPSRRSLHADPDFTRALRVRYTFESLQPLRVAVYDVDTTAARPEDLRLEQQDFLGADLAGVWAWRSLAGKLVGCQKDSW